MKDYSKPSDVDNLTAAFPGNLDGLLPPLSVIPEKYANPNIAFNSNDKWVRFQGDWMFRGIPDSSQPKPKRGIDEAKAWKHLSAIQNSFEPKHEHKVAAVAWLASLWFKNYKP